MQSRTPHQIYELQCEWTRALIPHASYINIVWLSLIDYSSSIPLWDNVNCVKHVQGVC
jgi:hypothetical protein